MKPLRFLMALVLLQAMTAAADDMTGATYQNNTGAAQSQLNLVLQGDVSGDVAATLNPFGAGGSVSTSFDGTYTTVTFAGTAIANLGSATVALDDSVASQFVNAYWGTSPSANLLPALTMSATSLSPGPFTEYLILFADVTQGGTTSAQWAELPVAVSSPGIMLPNVTCEIGDETVVIPPPGVITDPGFIVLPSQMPPVWVDSEPPPGYPGSPYTPLPNLNGVTLTPGSPIAFSLPDQSATIALLSLAAGGLLAGRRMFQSS
jgi:hypothetical protein